MYHTQIKHVRDKNPFFIRVLPESKKGIQLIVNKLYTLLKI